MDDYRQKKTQTQITLAYYSGDTTGTGKCLITYKMSSKKLGRNDLEK